MPSVRLQFIIDCRSKSAFSIRTFAFINDQNATTLRTRLMSSVHTTYSSNRYRVTIYTAHCSSFFTILSDPIYMSRLRTNGRQNRYFQSADTCLETFADQGLRGGKLIIKRPHTVLMTLKHEINLI